MKIENKRILITGGTGSFGNKVAAFLEQHNPKFSAGMKRSNTKCRQLSRIMPTALVTFGTKAVCGKS